MINFVTGVGMRRRQFIAAGMAVGGSLTLPGVAWAMANKPEPHWLVSQDREADGIARSLGWAGLNVLRTPDDPAALWYDHIAPSLGQGEAISCVSREGSDFILRQLAHLRGHLFPSNRFAGLTKATGFAAWQIVPRTTSHSVTGRMP